MKDEVAALKRERIVKAAVELFYERGYENTTLEAVADSLGVTKPFIYAQFASKAELLAEICSRGARMSLQALEDALHREATPTDTLRSLSQSFVVSVLENQKSIALFAREEKNLAPADFKRIADLRREFDRKLRAVLEAGQKSGEFIIADATVTAFAISGLVSWTYVWYRPAGRLSIRKLSMEIRRLIMAMVGSR
jgi:AcrR family transcriptional regulator